MQNLAVIFLGGSQHIVKVGDKLNVNKLNYEPGHIFMGETLLSTDNDNLLINEGKVELKVLEHKKGNKVKVLKFRAKSRYRRKKGHRQHLTTIQVISINGESLSN